MDRLDFVSLFEANIDTAIVNAEKILGYSIPLDIEIAFLGDGHSGTLMSMESAVDHLFLDEQTFYRIIDVSVIGIDEDRTRVFVRPSGHEPTSFDETWNTPEGNGPFKQLISATITDLKN